MIKFLHSNAFDSTEIIDIYYIQGTKMWNQTIIGNLGQRQIIFLTEFAKSF